MTKEELEKENARLTTNEKSLLAERKIIVKENAELKRDKEDLIFVRNQKADYINELKDQLTKAKEIIKTFLGFAEAFGYSPSMDKFISDTEQFISEVEK